MDDVNAYQDPLLPGIARTNSDMRNFGKDDLLRQFSKIYPDVGPIVKVFQPKGRRVSLLVETEHSGSFFVRGVDDAESTQFRGIENTIYELVSKDARLEPFLDVMPKQRFFDWSMRVFICEGLIDYENLENHYFMQESSHTSTLRLAGQALRRCHLSSRHLGSQFGAIQEFARQPPIPYYGELTPREYAHAVGRDFRSYLRLLQPISEALFRLRAQWTLECLTHGDFKGDNILVRKKRGGSSIFQVKFVDWELVRLGPASWDVGTFIGHVLSTWLREIRPQAGGRLKDWLDSIPIPIKDAHKTLNSFLDGYLEQTRDHEFVRKAIQYAGVFLIQRAQVSLNIYGFLTPFAYCCLHMGRTIITSPESSQLTILGWA